MKLLIISFLSSIVFSVVCFAGRSFHVAPIEYRAFHDLTYNLKGLKTNFSSGQKVGGGFHLNLELSNISELRQSGTVEILGSNMADLASSTASPNKTFTKTILLCADSTVSSSSGNPGKVNFSIEPGDYTNVGIGLVSTSSYGSGATQATGMSYTFHIRLLVKVNEDKGAIISTLSASPYYSQNLKVCGTTFGPLGYGRYINTEEFIPYFVNGGRPF